MVLRPCLYTTSRDQLGLYILTDECNVESIVDTRSESMVLTSKTKWKDTRRLCRRARRTTFAPDCSVPAPGGVFTDRLRKTLSKTFQLSNLVGYGYG